MTAGKALDGKPYAGNPHVRFDEGEVASAATPRRGPLLYNTVDVEDIGRGVKEQFRKFTGTEALEGFSLGGLFSDIFRHHETAEMEHVFAVGTPGNIPDLEDVNTSWPRPWMFFRMLIGAGVVYGLFLLCWDLFKNPNLLPGLIMTGAMMVPLATVLFFFEVNVRRNVSLYQVVRLLFLGGIVSLIFSLLLFASPLAAKWLGDSVAGIIEEPGKLIALLVVSKSVQYRYKLNGLLFGACVGAGFAIFESMGYAFRILIETANMDMVRDNILKRGVLSPFGHIAWTAIAGTALWRVKGANPFRFGMLWDRRFLGLFSVSIAMHMIWNLSLELPLYGKYALVGFLSWVVVLSLVQEGIREVRTEKRSCSSADCANISRTTGRLTTRKGVVSKCLPSESASRQRTWSN